MQAGIKGTLENSNILPVRSIGAVDFVNPLVYDTGLITTTTLLQHFKDVVTTKFSGRDHHLPPLHPHHQQATLHPHHQPHQAVAQGFSTIFPTYLGMDRASGGNAAGGGLGIVSTSATHGGGGGGALNGLEAMSAESTGLCLQDLVSAGTAAGAGSAGSAESVTTTSTALSSGSTGSSTVNSGSNASVGGSDHLHNHHSLHDTSSSVSISPAISSLMPIGSLSHLHHGTGQDLVTGYSQHPHHGVVPSHTPKHEPLEKLRIFSDFIALADVTVANDVDNEDDHSVDDDDDDDGTIE
ncbi:hypothetical protein GQX74_006673 [Glossina fuscipes]|nr:hypothetical protein GQX74_006673 [Glossina fuscipes]